MSLITLPALVISYIVTTLAALLISIEAWAIGIVLTINQRIISSDVVQLGFPITLSLANICFVLGIVIIAIATILRIESYGIKKALAKLVLMAVLVNFGLVICGVLLGFADNLTRYWLNQAVPQTQNVPGGNPIYDSFVFADALVGAFQPQSAILRDPGTIPNLGTGFWDNVVTTVESFFSLRGAMQSLIGSLFASFLGIFMVIILGVFIVMLLVRYMYLVVLLVLLPLAWVSWVFPATQGNWRKWWDKFIQQTLFAPIVVFFMWLTVKTAQNMNAAGGFSKEFTTGRATSALGVVKDYLGSVFASIAEPAMNAFVLAGLMLAGMMAAQSMGVHLAGAGVKAATGVAKGFGNYVGRRSKQFATAPLRQVDAQGKTRAQRITSWAGSIKNPVGRYTAGWAARGATAVSETGGKDNVSYYEKQYANASADARRAALLTGNVQARVALTKLMAKDGQLDETSLDITHNRGLENAYKNTGNTRAHKDLLIATGHSVEEYEAFTELQKTVGPSGSGGDLMVQAHRKLDGAAQEFEEASQSADGKAIVDAREKLDRAKQQNDTKAETAAEDQLTALKKTKEGVAFLAAEQTLENAKSSLETLRTTNKEAAAFQTALGAVNKAAENFASGLTRSDLSKMQLNDIHSGKAVFGLTDNESEIMARVQAHGISSGNPSLASAVLSKLKGKQINNFSAVYTGQLHTELEEATKQKDAAEVARIKKGLKSFATSVLNNTLGYIAEATPTTGATAATPAPAAPAGGGTPTP